MYKLSQRFFLPMPEKFKFQMESMFLAPIFSNLAQRNVSLASCGDTGTSAGHLLLPCNFQGRTYSPMTPPSELKTHFLLLILTNHHSCSVLPNAPVNKSKPPGAGSQETRCALQTESTIQLSQLRQTNSPVAGN